MQNKSDRKHLAAMVGIFALTVLLCLLFCTWQRGQAKQLLLLRERQVATALLAQGLPATAVAAALANTGVSAESLALMQKIGHAQNATVLLLPQLQGFYRGSLLLALPGAALLFALLLGEEARYLRARERFYRAACAVVERFAQGDFTHHLPRTGEGTLYRLLSAIDELAMALQAKGENERRAREALKDSVADISHQLKTPLAAISMYNEILAGAADDPQTVRCFTEKTARSLVRMQQLVLSLLKVMRLETGSVAFAAQACTVAQLAASAAQELMLRAEAEKKQLCFCGSASARLRCDVQWTAEALGNLLKNALEHTPPGGHICVYWQQTPALQRISVWDDGEGIPEEELSFIFKRFYRSPHSGDAQGAGLGLPMAKAITEQQGGVLSVKSTRGDGTTFTMSFPTQLTKP